MREGMRMFDHKWRGFAGESAQLIGCETRTSSPVHPRDERALEHPDWKGCIRAGEGAGYAGGIVSAAALDGRRCAEALAEQMQA